MRTAAAQAAAAGRDGPPEPPRLHEEITVTASKTPQPRKDVTQTVRTIGADEIAQLPFGPNCNLSELLSSGPGILVEPFSRNDANWGSTAAWAQVQQLPSRRPADRRLHRRDEPRPRRRSSESRSSAAPRLSCTRTTWAWTSRATRRPSPASPITSFATGSTPPHADPSRVRLVGHRECPGLSPGPNGRPPLLHGRELGALRLHQLRYAGLVAQHPRGQPQYTKVKL